MAKYIAKRILMGIVTAFVVATLTFFIMNMVPGGPFLSEKAVTPAAQAAMEAKYGLDKPLFARYLTYMGDLLHGDLGLSSDHGNDHFSGNLHYNNERHRRYCLRLYRSENKITIVGESIGKAEESAFFSTGYGGLCKGARFL